MALTFNEYLTAIKQEVIFPVARISLLRMEDETVYQRITGDLTGGRLDVGRNNGARRSIDITLENATGEYTPNEYTLWINSKFLVELGIRVDGEIKYFPQGIFVTKEPQVSYFSSGSTVSFSGVDKFSLLDGSNGGNLDGTYLIAVSTDINTAISTILDLYLDDNSQIPLDAKTPLLQALAPAIADTPYTFREDGNSTFGNLLLELNGMVSRNMYYNEIGNFVFEDDVLDSVKGSEFDFEDDDNIYLGLNETLRYDEVYNKIIVIGGIIDNEIFSAVSTNENPLSKTSINVIGVKLLSPIVEDNLYSDALCQVRADYELKRRSVLGTTGTISCRPLYHLDSDQVVTIPDEQSSSGNKRVVIDSFSIPFEIGGVMSVNYVESSELIIG